MRRTFLLISIILVSPLAFLISAQSTISSRGSSLDDFFLEVSAGDHHEYSAVTKFGQNTDVDAIEDVWSGGETWVAPTIARVHSLTGGVNDTALGTGARTIQVWGLPDWDTVEATEIVTMNGAGGVNTVGVYVIIHRMRVITHSTAGPNDAAILATAAIDGTVTARIEAGKGQTHMAIFGVPSVQTFHMGRLYANLNKDTGAATKVDVELWVNYSPNVLETIFISEHTFSIIEDGTSAFTILYYVPKVISGPAIVKITVTPTATNTDVSAGFDGILRTN